MTLWCHPHIKHRKFIEDCPQHCKNSGLSDSASFTSLRVVSDCFLCRELKDALPPLGDMTREALPKLAELHLSSASSMAHAIKLLVPGAFVNNNNKDGGGNSTSLSPNWQALCKEGEGVMSMVSSLIDLQLFHLLRAQAITAEMRFRIARRQLEGKQAAGAGAGVTTHKPCLCPTSGCCHCATLTK